MQWTDFIIVYFEKLIIKGKQKHSSIKACIGLWASIIYLLLSPVQAHAYETSRNLGNDPFDIELSTQVKEAVDNGIILNFDCELAINKQLWFISWRDKQKKVQFKLTQHSLSNRYLVSFNDTQAPKNFNSAIEATSYIKEQSISLFHQYASEHDNAKMRLSLNKFKLLGPMRLNAFISKQWNIDTGWISWSPEI